MRGSMSWTSRCIALVLLALSSFAAWSQATTIKIIVGFPPGGVNDALARMLAEEVGRARGPSIVIENRPGAASAIATEAAARAIPDGSTILLMGNSFAFHPHMKKVTYDPLTSFDPICYLAR